MSEALTGERSERVQGQVPPFNKQLYKNSGLAELFAADGGDDDSRARGFFNPRNPNLAIIHEKPEHRLLLLCKLQGASNREIAAQSGYTEPWISQLFRQPWAQRLLSEMMHEAGLDEVRALLKEAQVELRANARRSAQRSKSSGERSNARRASNLLEQYSGKPTQRVVVNSAKPLSSDDLANLNKQIEQASAEVNRLVGHL